MEIKVRRTAGRCQACGEPIEYTTDRELRDIINKVIMTCRECVGIDVELPRPKVKKRIVSYSEYLSSDQWAGKREKALKRARNACQVCKSLDDLEVHHNTYERISRELDSDLVVLCKQCYRLFHERVPGQNSGRVGLDYDPARKRKSRHELRREIQELRDLKARD
jgi:5-methylcytosine-specific restriction endonuclease McrA